MFVVDFRNIAVAFVVPIENHQVVVTFVSLACVGVLVCVSARLANASQRVIFMLGQFIDVCIISGFEIILTRC